MFLGAFLLCAPLLNATLSGCGKKQTVEQDKTAEPQKSRSARPQRDDPNPVPRNATPPKKARGDNAGASPARAGKDDLPPPEESHPEQRAARTAPQKITLKTQIPHPECNRLYSSGTTHYRAKNYKPALRAYIKYIEGRCLGRITKATDVWLTQRAFLSACHTENEALSKALRKYRKKACAVWSKGAPCNKAAACPGKTAPAARCNTLYTQGSQLHKSGDHTGAVTAFSDFAKTGCFGRLTVTTDIWAAYRALKSSRALGQGDAPFLSHLKAACKKKSSAWACKKVLGK
jgi:TolA-binding protein